MMEKGASVLIKKNQRWKQRWIVLRKDQGLAVYKTEQEYELLHLHKLNNLVACLHQPIIQQSVTSSKKNEPDLVKIKGRNNVVCLVFQHQSVDIPPLSPGPNQQQQSQAQQLQETGLQEVEEQLQLQVAKSKTSLVFIDARQRSVLEDLILDLANFRAHSSQVDVLSWHSLLSMPVIDAIESDPSREPLMVAAGKMADKTDNETVISIPTMSNSNRLGFICTLRPSFDADWWWTAASDMLVPFQGHLKSMIDLSQSANEHHSQSPLNTQSPSEGHHTLAAVAEGPEDEYEEFSDEEVDEDIAVMSAFTDATSIKFSTPVDQNAVYLPAPPQQGLPSIAGNEKGPMQLNPIINAPSLVGYLYKKKKRGRINSRRGTVINSQVITTSTRNIGTQGLASVALSAGGDNADSNSHSKPPVSILTQQKSYLDKDATFHTRYFVLRGSKLTWYQDAREYEVLKMLDMKDVVWIKLDLKMSKFSVSEGNEVMAIASSDSDSLDESDDDFMAQHQNTAKTLLRNLMHPQSTASHIASPSRPKKISKKSKPLSITFGLGVSQLSIQSIQSQNSSVSNGPANSILHSPATPVNVVVKQVALPTSTSSMMEISVVRPQSTPTNVKSVRMLAREWSSGIGILDEKDIHQLQQQQQQLALQGSALTTEELWSQMLKTVSVDHQLTERQVAKIKNVANEDQFLKSLLSAIKDCPDLTPLRLQSAWTAFFRALGMATSVPSLVIKEMPAINLVQQQQQDAKIAANNQTPEQLISKSVNALQRYRQSDEKHTRLYQIRLVTLKRDYVLATERAEEFVKWVVALRRSWVAVKI